jgi:non-ribosomal peptide synthetase component F
VGADRVLALLPRSRIIFLLRDGRDVVDSMLDAQLPGGWLEGAFAGVPADLERRRLELVRRDSRLWLARTQAVLRAYEAQAPELRLIVRYEEARANPDAELARLEAWLSVERTGQGHLDALRWNDFDAVPADAKGRGKPLRAAQPGLWRENLSEAEQAAMHAIMGEQLAALGYAL